jgi:hypothetical protein
MSDIIKVHAGISICTMKLCVNIQCWDFLFQEILSLQVGGGECPHRSFSRTEIWPHKGRVMWFSFRCEITNGNA